MKVPFRNYTYFDPNNNTEDAPGFMDSKRMYPHATAIAGRQQMYRGSDTEDRYSQYQFDKDHFDKLVANRQYDDAADYASKYHFNDPKVQREHENDIMNLRRNGRILGAIYGRVNDEKDLKQIEFYDAVFTDGGLERLQDNQFVTELEESKKRIVGNSSKISVTFNPEKKYGLFGIDWLAKDNEYNIDNFYNTLGLTANDLTSAGVEIIHKDGATELKFDPSNKYANKILYNTPTVVGESPILKYFPSMLLNQDTSDFPRIRQYDENGNRGGYVNNLHVTNFQDLINRAKDTKDKYFHEIETETKDYSSTTAPWISDKLYELSQMGLTPEEYNKQAKIVAPEIFDAIASLGTANYEMYSNYYNEESTDETLIKLENKERSDVLQRIAAYKPSDIHVDAMVSNGKIGALITLDPQINENEEITQKRIQLFVPGLLQEQAQARINRETYTSAIQEINSMLDWGYDYKLEDGRSISIGQNGNFIRKSNNTFDPPEEEISKEEAIRDIDRDMIITNSKSQLKYKYMNSKGEIINPEEYEQMCRTIALSAASELYSGAVKLADVKNRIYSIYDYRFTENDIFDRTLNEDSVQFETKDVLSDIYSMYNKLMKELIYYK